VSDCSVEVQELFRPPSGALRSPKQILGLLDRRTDCRQAVRPRQCVVLKTVDVQKNVETLKKQLEAARIKFDNVQIVSDTSTRNEEGLPVTDIYEELDEEGNVICKPFAPRP